MPDFGEAFGELTVSEAPPVRQNMKGGVRQTVFRFLNDPEEIAAQQSRLTSRQPDFARFRIN
jgi:hypothetical protein